MWKVDQVLQLFAPFECLNCRREGSLLCHRCGLDSVMAPPGRCYGCQNGINSAACSTCCQKVGLQSVWVATDYQGVAVQLIGRLKFARTQAAAALIARIMDNRLPAYPVETIVVHIPTAAQRVRQRGYDQAQLIAREFARYRQLPCQALLRRRGHSRQLGATRQERHEQLQGAFYCSNVQSVINKRVLLIDDVLTTGATIEAAARVMRSAGCREVSVALFAQKL